MLVLDIFREYFLPFKTKCFFFLCCLFWPVALCTSSCPFHLRGRNVPLVFSFASALNTFMLPTKQFLEGHSKSKDRPQGGSHFFKVVMFYFNHIGKFCVPFHADFNRKTIFPKWILLEDVCFLLLVNSSMLLETLLATAALLKQFSVNNENGIECCQGLGLRRYTTNLGSLHYSAPDSCYERH